MQSLETTRRLGEIDRDLIKGVLESLFERRKAGDIDGLLRLVAPEIVCFPDRSWGCARYPCRLSGKEAVREAFRQRHINYICVDMQVHRMLIDGDQAAVHRTTTLQERGTGVLHSYDSVGFYRFRDGLLVEFSELPDGTACDIVNSFPH